MAPSCPSCPWRARLPLREALWRGRRRGRRASAGAPGENAGQASRRYAPDEAALKRWKGREDVLRVVSWNVNGMRALLNKAPEQLVDVVRRTNPHHLVLQETKMQDKHVEEVAAALAALHVGDGATVGERLPWRAWSCSRARLGYSGVAVLSAEQPTWRTSRLACAPEPDIDAIVEEGRVLTVRDASGWAVVNAYVPNSGAGLKTLRRRIDAWEPAMRAHIDGVARGTLSGGAPSSADDELAGAVADAADSTAGPPPRGVVYTGDLNVAMHPIDLWGNHDKNAKSAGYTDEERASAAALLHEARLVDAFRHVHGDVQAFTYYDYRTRARLEDRGWRIDYTLIASGGQRGGQSDDIKDDILDAFVLDDIHGSDHVPVGVVLQV